MSFCLKTREKYYDNDEKLDCHMILYKIFCSFNGKVRGYFAQCIFCRNLGVSVGFF